MSAESGSAEVTTPEQAREEIHKLVERFASNLDAYKRAEYEEAHVRRLRSSPNTGTQRNMSLLLPCGTRPSPA